MGDVVIDDVSFLDCAPPLITNKPCTSEEYACANGHCIPQENMCDFINHCGDNSDEDHYICSEALSAVRLAEMIHFDTTGEPGLIYLLLLSFRGL